MTWGAEGLNSPNKTQFSCAAVAATALLMLLLQPTIVAHTLPNHNARKIAIGNPIR